MDRPQLIRRLRIAASVFFALLTAAICVLWVRSYWWSDTIHFSAGHSSGGLSESHTGDIVVVHSDVPDDWLWISEPVYPMLSEPPWDTWEFTVDDGMTTIRFPHWFPALAFGILAASLWIPLRYFARFSLRTLLIATTLVAVVLGLGVWAAR